MGLQKAVLPKNWEVEVLKQPWVPERQRGWRPLEQAGVLPLQQVMRLFGQVGEQPLLDEEELDEEEEDPPELEEELEEEQM